jgi:hypothetical protein
MPSNWPGGSRSKLRRQARRAAQRTLLLEANRRPPSLVDVSRAVTAGQGGVAVTAGWRAPQWLPPQLLHPARALGVRHISGLTCDDASRYPPDTPRLLDPPRGAIAHPYASHVAGSWVFHDDEFK